MLHHQKQKVNQKGRSLLEVMAVMVIIILLTIGGLWLYKRALFVHEANTIYEDVLVLGEGVRNRSAATNKKIYDSTMGTKSRTGTNMFFCPDMEPGSSCPAPGSKTFEVKVSDVSGGACKTLRKKDWPTDKVLLVKIGNNTYNPSNIKCDEVADAFDLTVVFSSGYGDRVSAFELPQLCKNGKCLSNCQECKNNVCVNKCPEGKYCAETSTDPQGVCQLCPATTGVYCGSTPSGVCDSRGCCSKTKQECNLAAGQVCANHQCINCSVAKEIGEVCVPECGDNACVSGAYCNNVTRRCINNGTGGKDTGCTGDSSCNVALGLSCKKGKCKCTTRLLNQDCSVCSCGTGLNCDSSNKRCVASSK